MNASTTIIVSDYLGHHNLVTRESATTLIANALCTPHKEIVLDFTHVTFISRSFADQLHKEMMAYNTLGKKKISFANALPDIVQMLKVVATTQTGNNRNYEPCIHLKFQSRRFLKEYLLSV